MHIIVLTINDLISDKLTFNPFSELMLLNIIHA